MTVHHWIKPALRYFEPNFLSTTVNCFRLTPANNSYWLFISHGPFNMLGVESFVVERHLFTVEVFAFFCSFDTVPSSILTLRFHAVNFFDNSENCFFFIIAMSSSEQVLCLHIIFLSSTQHILLLQALFLLHPGFFVFHTDVHCRNYFFIFKVFINSST